MGPRPCSGRLLASDSVTRRRLETGGKKLATENAARRRAPHAKLRKAVVAFGREPVKQTDITSAGMTVGEILARIEAEAQPASYLLALDQQPTEKPPNYTWAQLMQRAFEEDVLQCVCGGRLKFIACITKPEAISAILKHLGLPETPPTIAPARSPPELEYGEPLPDHAV
jgi:hypothetical protein